MQQAKLIERAVAALEAIGLKVLTLKQPSGVQPLQADAWLRVGKGRQHVDYAVEAKRAVTPVTLGAVLAQMKNVADAARRRVLLITDYLTPPVAEKLRAQKQQFVDAAGNAYLEGPGMFIFATGRKPPDKQTAPGGQAFTINGLKILFALICDPALAEAPQRAIAAAAGVALGAVPAVLQDLRQAGHLLVAGKRRRLNATKRLLDEWALAYARKLRAKTLHAKYETPNFDAWKNWQLNPEQVRWGGEPAAALLTGYLRPGVLTLYAEKLPPRLMVEQRLAAAGRLAIERLIEVRKPFWGKMLHAEARPDTVPPVLVYADLLATGDGRCMETAQMVYDDYLARLLPAA